MKFFDRNPKVIDNSTGEDTSDTPGSGDVKGRCNHRWGKTPQNPAPGACYTHWCGLRPGHPGKHVCMAKYTCGETE